MMETQFVGGAHEQEMGGAFHESRACSVGILEALEFIGKLIVHR